MVGNEALAITAQMPTGVPVATVGVDGRGERRDPGRRDPRRRRPGRADGAVAVQGRPGGGPQALIPRYSLPEMAAVWSDEARLANWLEIELLAVEAWAELGRIPAEEAAARPRARVVHRRGGARARARHPPRRRGVRRRGGRLGRPGGPLDPLRADVVRRAGHRPRAAAAGGGRLLLGRLERLLGGREAAGARASRHRDGRALARRPRRADQRSGTSSRCGRSSSTATGSGCAARARP